MIKQLPAAKKKADCVIGIDPDAEKSGVGFLEVATRKLECAALHFSDLVDYLRWAKGKSEQSGQRLIVIVEGGWLNHGNWHLPSVCSKYKAAAQGRSVGMNHQTGMLIVEMCKHLDIPCEVVKPLQKMWKGADRKITHEELSAITGIIGRTNQEMRDAALLAWWYAGLPIRIRVNRNNELKTTTK